MSKRQALGAIAINSNSGLAVGGVNTTASAVFNQHANRAANSKIPIGSSTASMGIFKPQQKATYNNENQPPPAAKSSGSNKPGGDFEFEIFQEERISSSSAAAAAIVQRNPLGSLPNPIQQQPRLREQQVNFFLDVPDEDDEEEEEEEEEEVVHDKRKHDDEDDEREYVDDDDDDDEDNKENDDEDGIEEEGISRLNIAAMMDSSSCASLMATSGQATRQQQQHNHEQLNTSHCELMMDSSSSTQNDESMLLDDTIKGTSLKSAASSLYIEDEDEQEEEEEEEEERSYDDREDNEYTDEEDEEVRLRQARIERDNVTMNFAEYKDEILAYMRKLELENRPKATYMKKQMDITSNMRSILVDWLVEVCEEYKLNSETLYLAVNYTDRFLSQMSVLRGKLQLVGTASMYIAAKYEEVTPPDIAEFVYITDDTYTKKQVLRMEHLLLKVLDFKMSSPTANWFLSHFLRFIRQNTALSHANNNELGQRIENLARYLCELTLIDSDTFLAYLPSQIAASAVFLSMYTLGRPWTKQVADMCGYSHDLVELKSCIQDMFKTMQGALDNPQQAIQEKYKHNKYDYVALIEPPKTLPPHLVAV